MPLPTIRRLRACLVAATLVAATVLLRAHVVVVEHVVEMIVQPQGARLLVRLHVPAAVLADASAIKNPLNVVAADIARNLDVQQDDSALAAPAALATIAADRRSIDVELTYAIRPDVRGISARLNAFRPESQAVRTSAEYLRPSGGPPLRVSVSGAPRRVLFDPGLADALLPIASEGISSLLNAGDHVLFLVCLLLPLRRIRPAAGLVAALAASQAAAILVVAARPLTEDAAAIATMVAASAVVILAIQTVVRAQLRWIVPLTLGFGALSGVAFGERLATAAPFAGSHQLGAVVVFVLAASLGQLWLGAIVWATRMWLNERGVQERVIAVLGSVVVAHEALHHVVDRGQAIAQSGSFGAEHALVWVTVGWAGVMVMAGLVTLFTRGAGHRGEQTPLAQT